MELEKTGAVAGDYIAERLGKLSHGERMTLLPNLGRYGGAKLHKVLHSHLTNLKTRYGEFVKQRGTDKAPPIDDWNNLPEEIKNIWGELYYGLTGLASFKDRRDLPFIRNLALWATKNRFKQTCDAALRAFRNMPDKANLPVIDAIWKEFSARQYKGNEMSPYDVTRALRTHRFPETVPVLVKLLGEKEAGSEAQAFLSEIVGKNLGPDPKTWLDWYRMQKK